METPLVSICSITYNHAPFIRQCLDGFLMQQCNFPIEIIINDDCSTDGTTEIIREYAEKYPDKIFPIFHEENLYSQGVRGMFQKFVFPKARGKYIALCEGDDYWTDPLKLQKQVDFLESHPDYSMCFHNAQIIYEEDNIVPKLFFHGTDEFDLTGVEIFEKWSIPTASAFIRKEVYESQIYKKASSETRFIYGDIVLFLSAAHVGKVKGWNCVYCVYRKHKGGVVYDLSYETSCRLADHNSAIVDCFGDVYLKLAKRATCRSSFVWFVKGIKSLQIIKAIKSLIRSVKSSPFLCASLIKNIMLHRFL